MIALEDVSLEVYAGELVGLIGADGAGKSSLMKIVLTLEHFDSGSANVMGFSLGESKREIRSRVGYMPEMFSLYPDLTVEENLNFFFQIYHIPTDQIEKKKEWLYEFNRLKPFAATRAANLSGGMKQKLALSCALINDPPLLVLDEPTTGVDPVSRMEFWKMLGQLKNSGKAILISTPYLDEAMQCDRMFLLHHGKVLLQGKPKEVVNHYPGKFIEIQGNAPQQWMKKLQAAFPAISFYLIGDKIHANVGSQEDRIRTFLEKAEGIRWQSVCPSLEDIFLDLWHENQDNTNAIPIKESHE